MPVPGVTHGPLRHSYEIVIVGAGVQGLALAYELARRGVRDVAVLDAGYPGCGASGRCGEMIRSAFASPEWVGFFDASLRRWHELSAELGFNVLFTPAGYLVLASTDEELEGFFLDCGWLYGFAGAPAGGTFLAEAILSGGMPAPAAPFSLQRLREGRLIREGSLVVDTEAAHG